MTDIDIDGSDFAEFADNLREAAANLDEAVDAALQKTALQVERSAKQKAPVDTGTLRASITNRPIDDGYVVGTNVEYAAAVEFGTRPHVITPNQADALAFEGQAGELIFRQRVEHPGTEAQPFLRPALRDHESDLTENIDEAIRAVFVEAFDT